MERKIDGSLWIEMIVMGNFPLICRIARRLDSGLFYEMVKKRIERKIDGQKFIFDLKNKYLFTDDGAKIRGFNEILSLFKANFIALG